MLPLNSVRYYASQYGWQEVQYNTTSRVVAFKRRDERVNVYYTTGTVGTCIDHPRRSKTQLFRRYQSMSDLIEIFKNPRVHTGAGYYRRHSIQRPEPSSRGSSYSIMCSLETQELQDALLEAWTDNCQTLALGEGYFIINDDGSTEYWHIPRELYNKVNGRQKSLPSVDYVVLGPDDYYFVQFCDGNSQWFGPESLTEALHGGYAQGLEIEILAFAPDDGWYVMWEDGAYAWENMPTGLHNKLNGRQKSLPEVEDLAIGPNGEWFVRFLDGAWRCNGISDELYDAIDEVHEEGYDVISIAFGHNWTWAITYS